MIVGAFIIVALVVLLLIYSPRHPLLKEYERLAHEITRLEYGPTSRTFRVLPSRDYSYTENKNVVYLVLTRANGSYFKRETHLSVLLHEVAHVLSEDVDHTPNFHSTLRRLRNRAYEMRVLNSYEENIEEDYPCHR